MSQVITRVLLSGSSGGEPILVVATATPGTAVHSTGVSAAVIDEVFLSAINTDTTDRKLTIEFGGVTAPNHLIEVTIPAEVGLVPILQGMQLTGTGAAARNIKAFAATANVITLVGHINRIT